MWWKKQSRFSSTTFPSFHRFSCSTFLLSSLRDNISYREFTSSFEKFFIDFYELFDVYFDLSFILVMILAWVILRRIIYILLAQEGYKGFEFFSDKETWPHIISNHYCFIFKKVNPEKQFNTSQHMSFFNFSYISLLYCPFFCLDCLHRFSI